MQPTSHSPRRVLLFGAGASMEYRGVKGPLFLDSEFFRIVENDVWGEWCAVNDMGRLGEFQHVPMDHTGMPWEWPALKAHIESIAGRPVASLGMEEAFGLLSVQPNVQFVSLCRAIELALFWRLRLLSPKAMPSHVAFLNNMLHAGDTILTLNYDPLLEVALTGLPGIRWDASTGYGLKFDAELSGLDVVGSPVSDLPSDSLLLKLHGSMNWLVPAMPEATPRKYLFRISPDSYRGAGWKVHRGVDSEPLRPLFVPPEPAKDYVRYGLEPLWIAASKALSDAEELYIVGYSFPQTDERTTSLIRDHTPHLREKETVHFVTRSSASQAVARFKRLFPTGVVHSDGFAAYAKGMT